MYIGIDPGLRGAVAVLGTDGVLLALHDVPVLTLSTSRGSRTEYDLPRYGRVASAVHCP